MNIIEWFWNDGELLMIMGVGIIIVGIILKKKKNKTKRFQSMRTTSLYSRCILRRGRIIIILIIRVLSKTRETTVCFGSVGVGSLIRCLGGWPCVSYSPLCFASSVPRVRVFAG